MTKTSVLIEAAMQILSIAQKEENVMMLRGVVLNYCPDELIEKEMNDRSFSFLNSERMTVLGRELSKRRTLGIKIIETGKENNENEC